MKKYSRSWTGKIEGEISNHWTSMSEPMSLTIKEEENSKLFIAASLEFLRAPNTKKAKNKYGSLYYKIEVNGKPIEKYHVSNPIDSNKGTGVNLHAKTQILAGENNIEVFFKGSKNASWDLLKYQGKRQLSVLTLPFTSSKS